jgi:hypothetical protein
MRETVRQLIGVISVCALLLLSGGGCTAGDGPPRETLGTSSAASCSYPDPYDCPGCYEELGSYSNGCSGAHCSGGLCQITDGASCSGYMVVPNCIGATECGGCTGCGVLSCFQAYYYEVVIRNCTYADHTSCSDWHEYEWEGTCTSVNICSE